MRSDLTDITLVVDRSGSMQEIRSDAEGGVRAFIEKQAKEPGEALLTIVQFDTEYEFVCKGIPIAQAPEFELVPRGSTALLDAIGRAMIETGQRLEAMAEQDRPGLVIFVVMTDGQENASTEFTSARIKEMTQLQQETYNWHFTFLGADQDSFAEAQQMGIADRGTADFSKEKVMAAYDATHAKVARMRKQRFANDTVVNDFTAEEREDMK
jgi:Mg-chelatase subunit ChlD